MQHTANRQALAAAHRQAARHWTAAARTAGDPGTAALYHQRAQENRALADEAAATR